MGEASKLELSEQFRTALRGIAATVCVVTSTEGKREHGMTVTSVTSLSMDPPALLICINRDTYLHSILRQADGFCVSVLASGQEDVSGAFSGKLDSEERFRVGDWRRDGPLKMPYLADAQSNLFCRKNGAFPYGTHTILVGDILAVRAREACAPLVYQNAGYSRLAAPQSDLT